MTIPRKGHLFSGLVVLGLVTWIIMWEIYVTSFPSTLYYRNLRIDLKDRLGKIPSVYSKSEIYVSPQFTSPLLAL